MVKGQNYLKPAMADAYDVLIDNWNPWPLHFGKDKKLKLLDSFIDYWQVEEEYEKCDNLLKIKNEIENV